MESTSKVPSDKELGEREAGDVSGGDCVAPDPQDAQPEADPVWRALQDMWNGLFH